MAATAERTGAVEDTPVQFSPLSDDIIARQTDANSFSRGKTYFRGKRIFNAVRRGPRLSARCRGSSGGPYLVEATLASVASLKSRNPVAFHCNCPRGGFCKHVVALLLAWIDKPDMFDVRPPLSDLLATKSRDELVALIDAMVATHPDLEPLIELPPPTAITPDSGPVDEAAIRRLVDSAFAETDYEDYEGSYGYHRYDYGYDQYPFAEGELERVVDFADAYIAAGQWRNAMLVSVVLAERLPTDLAVYADEEGTLGDLIRRTDANLAACLEAQAQLATEERLTTAERARLIDAILEIWEADLDAGGLDFSDGGPEAIGALGTPEEQLQVRERLRAMMRPAAGDPSQHQWRNRAVIGFILELQGDAGLSDEELLAELCNAELWSDAAALLLEQGRVEEAMGLAARKLTSSIALIDFADRLRVSGGPEGTQRAISLVDDRLWEREGQSAHDDQRLRQWLEQRYLDLGKPDKALELARSRFKASPTKATFDAVKAAALHSGQTDDPWPALRVELITVLAKSKNVFALIDIHLEAEEVAEALRVLAGSRQSGKSGPPAGDFAYYGSPESYSARVAAAAEVDFPDEAIGIYKSLAEAAIASRGRPAYQTAASYLVRVRDILEANGRGAEWKEFIADLRTRHKALRALREELDALGLN